MVFWKLGRKETRIWTVLFLIGFMGGIMAVCLFPGPLMENTGFLDASFLTKLRFLEINRNGLFLFSLRSRLTGALEELYRENSFEPAELPAVDPAPDADPKPET